MDENTDIPELCVINNGHRVKKETSHKSLRKYTIELLVESLLKNQGPDNHGKAWTTSKVNAVDLEFAIFMAEENGLPKGFRPYHFRDIIKIWNKDCYLDEVLIRGMDQLLKNKYKNDIGTLIKSIKIDDFYTQITENIGSKQVSYNMSEVLRRRTTTIYGALMHYLKLKGLGKQFKELKPYHVSKTDIKATPAIRNAVLKRKIDNLIKEKYDNNIRKFIQNTNYGELTKPLEENVGGVDFSISMHTVGKSLDSSPYKMIKEYLKIKRIEKVYSFFKPHHMKKCHNNYHDNQENIDALLTGQINYLLKTKYNSDLERLKRETTVKELFSRFEEEHLGETWTISTKKLQAIYHGRPKEVIRRYEEIHMNK